MDVELRMMVADVIKGLMAQQVAQWTGCEKDEALDAVQRQWTLHTNDEPDAGNAYQMVEDAIIDIQGRQR